MKKAVKRSPFACFARTMKDDEGQPLDMVSAVKQAGPLWERMSEIEREPYYFKANKNADAKMTSLQENINAVHREEERLKTEENDMKRHIDHMITGSFAAVEKQFFNVLHINDFLLATSSTRQPYPAEIGMAKFNLQEGVLPENIYSEVVKPGQLELGFAAEAKELSAKTHLIPPPEYRQDMNMDKVMKKIDTFMLKNEPQSYKIIYVNEKQIIYIRKFFDYMCAQFGYKRENYRIYSLQYLFYTLRNSAGPQSVWPSISMAKIELEKDIYDHTSKISCELHELLDASVYCSRSIVTRYIYIICDNCCPPHKIQLIPGQHVPENSLCVALDDLPVTEYLTEYFSCGTSDYEANTRDPNPYGNDEPSSKIYYACTVGSSNSNGPNGKVYYPFTVATSNAGDSSCTTKEDASSRVDELKFVDNAEDQQNVKPPLRRPNTISASKKPLSKNSAFGINNTYYCSVSRRHLATAGPKVPLATISNSYSRDASVSSSLSGPSTQATAGEDAHSALTLDASIPPQSPILPHGVARSCKSSNAPLSPTKPGIFPAPKPFGNFGKGRGRGLSK